jgi:hypothetical protein
MKYAALTLALIVLIGIILYVFIGKSSVSLLSVPLQFGSGGADSKHNDAETGRIITDESPPP